ncbi:MAG: hypothetical protein QGG42_16950 [Phycisphaerae bacterium]|nr:hypothetical protein [Phycisphaerae bacterium]
MFRVLAVRTVYGSVDTSPEQFATKEIIQEIKAICRRPVKDCPEAFYAYFLERYPSEKSLVTAYSQLQPGPQLADRTFVDRTEHAALVLASLCEMDFNKSIPSRLPHESWDVYVGGASRWVSAYIFEKNGIEGVVLQVKPGEKQDKNLPKEEIARRLALVSAAMIDGLVAEAK